MKRISSLGLFKNTYNWYFLHFYYHHYQFFRLWLILYGNILFYLMLLFSQFLHLLSVNHLQYYQHIITTVIFAFLIVYCLQKFRITISLVYHLLSLHILKLLDWLESKVIVTFILNSLGFVPLYKFLLKLDRPHILIKKTSKLDKGRPRNAWICTSLQEADELDKIW